jgi:hypothetical protein
LFVGGSLAAAILACQAQEKTGPVTTSVPSLSTTPDPGVVRGGFGQTFIDEAVAGSIFVSLVASLFWWSSLPAKGKRRAGS